MTADRRHPRERLEVTPERELNREHREWRQERHDCSQRTRSDGPLSCLAKAEEDVRVVRVSARSARDVERQNDAPRRAVSCRRSWRRCSWTEPLIRVSTASTASGSGSIAGVAATPALAAPVAAGRGTNERLRWRGHPRERFDRHDWNWRLFGRGGGDRVRRDRGGRRWERRDDQRRGMRERYGVGVRGDAHERDQRARGHERRHLEPRKRTFARRQRVAHVQREGRDAQRGPASLPERREHRPRVVVAGVALDRERAREPVIERRRQIGPQRAHRRERAARERTRSFRRAVAGIRASFRERVVDAHREQKTSHRSSTSRPIKCSGLMYAGVRRRRIPARAPRSCGARCRSRAP